MGSLDYIHSKPYRNRLSLFLQLPSKKPSPGVSSNSYPGSTPASLNWTESTSALVVPAPSFRASNPGTLSPLVPHFSMRPDTNSCEESIPPTTNELDAREKAVLLKKARKLSRVFGEVPEFQRSSTYNPPTRSTTPTPRRSGSTHSSDLSSRKRARRSPSQSDLNTSFDSGSRMEDSDREFIPPVPPLALPRRDNEASQLTDVPRRHRKISSLSILAPLKLSNDGHTTNSPSSDNLPNESPKHRMTKLRRFSKEESANVVKTRKSFDSSVVDQAARGKHLQRSRSLTPHKKVFEEDNAVGSHRHYVQTSGKMTRRQIPEDTPQLTPLPDASVSPTNDGAETRRMSLISVASSIGLNDPDALMSPSSASLHSIDTLFSESAFDDTFRDRRRRAAKLAQFFGVGYQDITASLPIPDYLSASVQNITQSLTDTPSEPFESEVHVDIRTNTKRFWGFGDSRGNLKEADNMDDVIGKLRELRAS